MILYSDSFSLSTTSLYILSLLCFFFFNDTATTEIYTLSLHDALPILGIGVDRFAEDIDRVQGWSRRKAYLHRDRKSTRLNSSHTVISYAVFCLKKKKRTKVYRIDRVKDTQDLQSLSVATRDEVCLSVI